MTDPTLNTTTGNDGGGTSNTGGGGGDPRGRREDLPPSQPRLPPPPQWMTTLEAQSPFLNNLLRFSPKQQPQHHHHQYASASRNRSNVGGPHYEDHQQQQEQQQQHSSSMNDETTTMMMDGIPIHHLRALVQSSLLSSPATASFYANIVYGKTRWLPDAYALAQAHYYHHKYDTCLRIMEESQLLQWTQYYPNLHDNDTSDASSSLSLPSPSLLWDAVLVAAQALLAKRDYTTLIDLLEDITRFPPSPDLAPHQQQQQLPLEDDDQIGWMTLKRIITSTSSSLSSTDTTKLHPLSLICYYRGLAYYETGCTIRATTFWKWALIMDSHHQMAWQSLLEHHLFTPTQAYEFLVTDDRLTFSPHQDWIRALYLSRINVTTTTTTTHTTTMAPAPPANDIGIGIENVSTIHSSTFSPMPTFHVQQLDTAPMSMKQKTSQYDRDPDPPTTTTMNHESNQKATTIQKVIDQAFDKLFHVYQLQNSSPVLAVAARRAYRRYDWNSSLLYCLDLAQLDPTVEEASFTYIATLVMLGHSRVLFRLAHEWVDATPQAARSWFAVGAYYYSIHRYHMAQRHFCRATRLNPQCTEAWIALGCSFAACDESDQALASFRAAQRLSPGEHSSLLYMGMEYVRTNHLVLASHFLQAAVSASGGDPLCFHELGVLAAHQGDHNEAIQYFRQAMSTVGGGSESLQQNMDLCDDVYWEPTIFNLGHSYRKCRQFDNALICFHRCVTLCPEKYSTYSALAFTKHLLGHIDDAISFYHKALGLKPDDPFCTDMLSRAFHDQITTPQDIFNIGLPPASKATATPLMTTDSRFLSTPNVFSGRKKDGNITAEDMELDLDMSVAS